MYSFASLPVEKHLFLTKLHHFTCRNLSYNKTSSNPDFTSSEVRTWTLGLKSGYRISLDLDSSLSYVSHPIGGSQYFKANLSLPKLFSKAVYLA